MHCSFSLDLENFAYDCEFSLSNSDYIDTHSCSDHPDPSIPYSYLKQVACVTDSLYVWENNISSLSIQLWMACAKTDQHEMKNAHKEKTPDRRDRQIDHSLIPGLLESVTQARN